MDTPQPDIWIDEPHVRQAFEAFPYPLAMIRRDGSLLALNRALRAAFDPASVEHAVRHRPDPRGNEAWFKVPLARVDGSETLARARAVDVGEDRLFVFERPGRDNTPGEVGELQRRVEQLERLVATDHLTGAWNRAHLDRMIGLELSRCERYRQPLSLILLDIDHFKHINDAHGHAAGDAVLQELVRVTLGCIRTADALFRWGGEEFVVMAPSTAHGGAHAIAEKIRAAVAHHVFPPAGQVTVSLGVAERLPGESAAELFARVDRGLYAAKSGGRNQVSTDARGASDDWGSGAILHLRWSEALECGEPTIDRQHRELFDLSNRLIDAALFAGADRAPFERGLDQLLSHIAQHFSDEETILAARRYPRLEEHRRAHAGLLARATAMRRDAGEHGPRIGALIEFVAQDVVARHLMSADRDFFPLFGPPRSG